MDNPIAILSGSTISYRLPLRITTRNGRNGLWWRNSRRVLSIIRNTNITMAELHRKFMTTITIRHQSETQTRDQQSPTNSFYPSRHIGPPKWSSKRDELRKHPEDQECGHHDHHAHDHENVGQRPLHIMSSSCMSPPRPFFFSSWILRPRPRISLQSTSNDTGVPASSVLVPLTIDS